MVERHRDGMKASPTIDTGPELELAHPRDQALTTFAPLSPTKVAGSGVVRRVVSATARLAPQLVAVTATVEVSYRLR
jgi:hypothetical protein